MVEDLERQRLRRLEEAALVRALTGESQDPEILQEIRELREKLSRGFGALAEYGALFRGREAATNLARVYQVNGYPAFVYFDPNVPVFDVEASRTTGVRVQEVDPETGRPTFGMWRVEVGEPTEAERQLVQAGRARVIPKGESVPPDPQKHFFLEFPPVTEFGAIARPTVLDACVDAEYGGILIRGASEKAPCDCVSLPPEGKLLCTREGVIGLLSQTQVRENCSEYRPQENGRLKQAQKLRDGQAVCGALVEGIPEVGERFARRFECLSEYLTSAGISL